MPIAYIFRSPDGVFSIRPESDGRWALLIGEERLGNYAKAAMAADDVYAHVTGCNSWDMRAPSVSEPTDLSEWEGPNQAR